MLTRIKNFINWLLHRHKKERPVHTPEIKGLVTRTSFISRGQYHSFEERAIAEFHNEGDITDQERQKDAEANEKYRREHEGW